MATFGEDVKQNIKENLREKIEESTGIIGQTLRAKREAAERDAKVVKQVEKIKQKTKQIDTRAKILTRMDLSFLQISKNLQSIAKVLKAQVTLQDETNAVIRQTQKHEETKQQNLTQQVVPISEVTDTKEESTIFDKINDLLDVFEKKTKGGKGGKRPPKETPKQRAKRLEKEKTQRGKVEDKATAAKKAAEEEARAAGKSAKEITKAGQKAATKVAKEASAAAVKAAARKALLKSIGKFAAKSIPFVGAAAGVAFAVERLMAGDPVGAGVEVAGGLGGALTSIPATIINTTRDVYYEVYGVYPEEDDSPDKAERYQQVYKIVEEEVRASLKNAVYPKPQAPEGMEFDAEGNVIKAPTPVAKPAPPPPAPPPPPPPPPTNFGAVVNPYAGQVATQVAAPPSVSSSSLPSGIMGGSRQPTPPSTETIRAVTKAKLTQGLQLPDQTVGDAIKAAAQKVGVDESIMLAMAKQESGFKADAKAGTSSAKGLFQFIDKTWNSFASRFSKTYPELLRGPLDPFASAIAGALYIKENSAVLQNNKIPVTGTNIYASHFLGAGGAVKLLKASPTAIAAEIPGMEGPAAANKYIFFKPGKDKKPDTSMPRTVAEIVEVLYGKVGAVADQYAALKGGATSGQDVGQSSTAVASIKKDMQQGTGQTTIVAITNVQQTGKAPPRAPQPGFVPAVG